MTITYCCYGAYADIGHSDDCKGPAEVRPTPSLADLTASLKKAGVVDVKFAWNEAALAAMAPSQARESVARFIDSYLRGEGKPGTVGDAQRAVAWQARKGDQAWGPPGTSKKAFDQLAAEGYEVRALGVLA